MYLVYIDVPILDMVGVYLIFGLMQLHTVFCVVKSWKSEPNDWQPIGYHPECAQSSIVYKAVGSVESVTPNANRIVLPEYGAIIIQDTNPIILQAEPNPQHCPSGWQNYLKQGVHEPKSWFSPEMWYTENEPLNLATPHIDRIPCECDTVSIVTNYTMSIRLNDLDEVVVNMVTINGQSGSLRQLIGSELGTMLTGHSETFAVDAQCSPQQSYCGCHSPSRFKRVQEAVCENVQCPVIVCESPVRPLGHCCSICGAVLQTKITANDCKDSPNTHVANQMQGALRGKDEFSLLSQVYIYENFYPNFDSGIMDRFILQLVLVDRGVSYEEHSSQLATIIGAKFPDFTLIQRSGRILDPSAASSFWTLILGSLFFVGCIYIVFYVHYEKQWFGFVLPTSRFERLINSRMTVSRYDQVTMAGGVAQIATTNPSPSAAAATTVGIDHVPAARSFDNPMFKAGSTSGSEAVSNMDHIPIATIGPNSLAKFDDRSERLDNAIEFENLVDISLDSTETINH